MDITWQLFFFTTVITFFDKKAISFYRGLTGALFDKPGIQTYFIIFIRISFVFRKNQNIRTRPFPLAETGLHPPGSMAG